MKIKEAKENVMKNFRANYTNDHMAIHDIEVFLLNTLEQIETVVKKEFQDTLAKKLNQYQGRYGCENTKHEIITIIKNHTC